jgi:hypothetical protein
MAITITWTVLLICIEGKRRWLFVSVFGVFRCDNITENIRGRNCVCVCYRIMIFGAFCFPRGQVVYHSTAEISG